MKRQWSEGQMGRGAAVTVDIRPLRLSDCEKIGPLLREIWLDAYRGIQTGEELLAQSHKVHTPEQIAKEIDSPNVHSVVAVSDDRIIGHARSDLNEGVVDIVRLFILRAFYGRGIGKALLREADSYFDPNMKSGSMCLRTINGR